MCVCVCVCRLLTRHVEEYALYLEGQVRPVGDVDSHQACVCVCVCVCVCRLLT